MISLFNCEQLQSQALVKHQGVFEDLIQAPEVANRHKQGYIFEYYQDDIIQNRKRQLENYIAEENHLLWGTEYTYAQPIPLENPLDFYTETEARYDEPYFSGGHPEYKRYSEYTNALHVAAQYAYLFTQDAYLNQSITLNGTSKLAQDWAVEISLKVLQDLYETVTDDDLDIWNGTYRENKTWGRAVRYVKGVHFRPVNPYFVSISKASAMWDSFALISQIISEENIFNSEQKIIYDWLIELSEYAEAALDRSFEYYVSDWRLFGNYENGFKNASIFSETDYKQSSYYYDSNGNQSGGKIHAIADVGNNRNLGHLEYIAKTATYTENQVLKVKVKDYLRRIYEVATSTEGANVDIQRNNGPGFTELNYTWIALSEIAMIAQHHANYAINSGNVNDWDEFYALTFSEGVEDRMPTLDDSFATGNSDKNLKLMLDYQAGFLGNSTRFAFDGELFSMDNGTGTIIWRSFQMFDGGQSSINDYLDVFNGQYEYNTSLWGKNEGLMSWHKWETVFGGPYSIVNFPDLYPKAVILRGNIPNDGKPIDPINKANAATPSPNESNTIGDWTLAQGGTTVNSESSDGNFSINLTQIGVGDQYSVSKIVLSGLKQGETYAYSWDIKSNNSTMFYVSLIGGQTVEGDAVYSETSSTDFQVFEGSFIATIDNPILEIHSNIDEIGNGGSIDNIRIDIAEVNGNVNEGNDGASNSSNGEVGSVEAYFYKVIVYPNPLSEEILTIRATEFPNMDLGLVLYDLDGKQLKTEQITSDDEGQMTLDVGFLVAGIYFLNIWNLNKGEIIGTKKLIKL
ncbi:T9SS type A sorting domain-containing protein [Maribacter sp. CXY002]|uniref:T9SS type A sorting domain-containing protein n=1 Tax=Maribacter luteocoastalis TaxID=3407671 RepID=UPI003B674980